LPVKFSVRLLQKCSSRPTEFEFSACFLLTVEQSLTEKLQRLFASFTFGGNLGRYSDCCRLLAYKSTVVGQLSSYCAEHAHVAVVDGSAMGTGSSSSLTTNLRRQQQLSLRAVDETPSGARGARCRMFRYHVIFAVGPRCRMERPNAR
jgi:hypothetical protein